MTTLKSTNLMNYLRRLKSELQNLDGLETHSQMIELIEAEEKFYNLLPERSRIMAFSDNGFFSVKSLKADLETMCKTKGFEEISKKFKGGMENLSRIKKYDKVSEGKWNRVRDRYNPEDLDVQSSFGISDEKNGKFQLNIFDRFWVKNSEKYLKKRFSKNIPMILRKTNIEYDVKFNTIFSDKNEEFFLSQIKENWFDNVLVFAEEENIFVIDIDNFITKIASRDSWIRSLCSHNGELYDGGDYLEIYETLSNTKIASRKGHIRALCSHNGKLYDGGEYVKIYETLSNTKIASRKDWVYALCSHNGKLYDGESYLCDRMCCRIYKTLSNTEIASRKGPITALCSHPRKYFVDAGIL